MGFRECLQTDVLYRLQQAEEPGAQFHRQMLDFGVDGREGLDRPAQRVYIADPLYSCQGSADRGGRAPDPADRQPGGSVRVHEVVDSVGDRRFSSQPRAAPIFR